jgi:hypothetical protein
VASSTLNYVRQQRVLSHPVVVHCLDGSAKTALFCLITAALAEVNVGGEKSGKIIPDMVRTATLAPFGSRFKKVLFSGPTLSQPLSTAKGRLEG